MGLPTVPGEPAGKPRGRAAMALVPDPPVTSGDPAPPASLVRIERGNPGDDEVAATVLAVLMALADAAPPPRPAPRPVPGWRRPAGYGAPGAWTSA